MNSNNAMNQGTGGAANTAGSAWDNPQGSPVLMHIRRGMEVHDADGGKVGSVDVVYFGSTGPSSVEAGAGPARASGDVEEDSFFEDLAHAFTGDDDNIPETLRGRLMQNGYIRIDTGLLGGHRYATPESIAGVRGDNVILVSGAELLDL